MSTLKRKKPQKSYTYHEYAQKFRPKSLPEETDVSDEDSFIYLTRPIANDAVQENPQSSSDPDSRRCE